MRKQVWGERRVRKEGGRPSNSFVLSLETEGKLPVGLSASPESSYLTFK